MLLRTLIVFPLLGCVVGKWVTGHIDTKENWAFLARFCFLSLDGQFEYLIEFDKDMGTPNLLLYYDDDSQWPSVYHSSKTCKQREEVLNKGGLNQIVKLSHWYPDTEFSGCVITKENRELPASKSSSTTTTTNKPKTTRDPDTTKSPEPSYYDQFLITTESPMNPKPFTGSTTNPKSLPDSTTNPKSLPGSTMDPTTIVDNNATWYEIVPTNEFETTTEDVLWESVGDDGNNLDKQDVEMLFSNDSDAKHKIKRSTELYERFHRRRLAHLNTQNEYEVKKEKKTEKLIVSCHNTRRFRSARERWWFIAVSNCDSTKGLDIRYKFLMTNGPEGDFWHAHFSADEFYVLPVLLAYTLAYVIVMVAVVMCSVELKSRHLLHSTYKLFLVSIVAQHSGVSIQALASVKYAANGFGGEGARILGQFLCGISEMTFLLLLILMAKGYTITRGRLKASFTVKLTVLGCAYCATYVALFIYQAHAFDPGEVLYLYDSVVGYCLIGQRVLAWFVFAYATFFTVNKFPEKNMFYCPFFTCGSLWFHAGPLFILTANYYIDKWVRESVVTAVLLFIAFSGHLMFLLLTLPVFANKNFPYHVRTTQIGIMEVTGNTAINNFGQNPYQPSAGAAQTVIIPLTRRTEELIGNMYSQFMATAPPLMLNSNISPKLNGNPRNLHTNSPNLQQLSPNLQQLSPNLQQLSPNLQQLSPNLQQLSPNLQQLSPNLHTIPRVNGIPKMDGNMQGVSQESSDTNNSDDIKPILRNGVFTIEKQMEEIKAGNNVSPENSLSSEEGKRDERSKESSKISLPSLQKRRTILEPIKRDDPPAVPPWSLAKGPSVVAMMCKKPADEEEDTTDSQTEQSLKKVPTVRKGLPSSGEISTILEGRVQNYTNSVSNATLDLFSAGTKRN